VLGGASYRDKFIDFINVFLSQHIQRMESALQPVSLLELLEQLFRFTFMLVRPSPSVRGGPIATYVSFRSVRRRSPPHQATTEAFQSCLHTWSIFITYLSDRATERLRTGLGGDAAAAPELRYRDGLLAFAGELLKKMQFKYVGRDLNRLDDTNEDAEVRRTAWKQRSTVRALEGVARRSFHAAVGRRAPRSGTSTWRTASSSSATSPRSSRPRLSSCWCAPPSACRGLARLGWPDLRGARGSTSGHGRRRRCWPTRRC